MYICVHAYGSGCLKIDKRRIRITSAKLISGNIQPLTVQNF